MSPTTEPEPGSQAFVTKTRPNYCRTCTVPLECHPTQIARARLGDTRGAMYLPIREDSPPRSPGTPLTVSIFGTSGHPSPSHTGTSSLTSYTVASSSVQRYGRRIIKQSATGQQAPYSTNCPPAALIRSVSDPSNLFSLHETTKQDTSNVSTSSDSACGDASPLKGQEVDGKVTRKVISSIDGASDAVAPASNLKKRRRSSAYSQKSMNCHSPNVVRFSSNDDLRKRYIEDLDQDDGTQFRDPFTGTLTPIERRQSDSSGESTYLRPNAFSGHRDTLARLHPSRVLTSNNTQLKHNHLEIWHSMPCVNAPINRFAGHRDTLARLHFDQNKSKLIPSSVLYRILRYLSLQDYNNLRLTCYEWHEALPHPISPTSTRLPAEVLQQIYQNLQPCDFDAARHTCRSWFLASLDRMVGHPKLKQAGCYSAFLADLEFRRNVLHLRQLKRMNQAMTGHEGNHAIDSPHDIREDLNEEWLISKRLATEARLSTAWRGSGLSGNDIHPISRLAFTEAVHFRRSVTELKEDSTCVKKFTVSTCGKFLLMVLGTDILVYSTTTDTSLTRPCVRLVAGNEVLAVSMDTSSGRYAIAVLLEGRIGMCWQLYDVLERPQTSKATGESISLGMNADVASSDLLGNSPFISLVLPSRRGQYGSIVEEALQVRHRNGEAIGEAQHILFGSGSSSVSILASPTTLSSLDATDQDVHESVICSRSTPVLTKPTHVYTSLGCSTDSPRSVAVCPQRKCVAFGCRTGIELHWVDALTGRDLNRWFPLAAPSDFLYFLPCRSGVGSGKKLRLISSAARPLISTDDQHDGTSASPSFSTTSRRYGRQQSLTRLFFGRLPFPSSFEVRGNEARPVSEGDIQGVLRTVDCDHYRAIPLSDGIHMLFTDPLTGFLCLGSDAPLGSPTKLVRKVCMVGPQPPEVGLGLLNCYVAGQDLRWGVRIVAAYNNGSIVLYNIPRDCFENICNIQVSPDIREGLSGATGEGDVLMDLFMTNPVDTGDISFPVGGNPSSPSTQVTFNPLRIHGSPLCRVEPDVEDLQLDCNGGGLQLWIFHHSGHARRMNLYVPRNHHIRPCVIGTDGVIRSAGDIKTNGSFRDADDAQSQTLQEGKSTSQSSPSHIRFVGLDGVVDLHLF